MAHVATITIDHTKVPGDLTDYVGLIVPDGSAGYSALYALCLEGGGDIRLFKSDDTTEIAREIVTFSVSSETGEIHYRYAGTLSSSVDTDIHVYADGSSSDYGVTATYGRNAVWVDYRGVWHMQADGTDSTGNLNNTDVGLTYAAAQIGDGAVYNASGDRITTTTGTSPANVYNFQSWFKTVSTNQQPIFTYTNAGGDTTSGYQISLVVNSSGNISATAGPTTSGTYRDGAWYKVDFTGDGSGNGKLYVDGALNVSGGAHNPGSTTLYPMVGRNAGAVKRSFGGTLDEVRWRLGDNLSADWIETEYNNQNSYSTFYSVAAVGGGSTPAQASRRGAVMMM